MTKLDMMVELVRENPEIGFSAVVAEAAKRFGVKLTSRSGLTTARQRVANEKGQSAPSKNGHRAKLEEPPKKVTMLREALEHLGPSCTPEAALDYIKEHFGIDLGKDYGTTTFYSVRRKMFGSLRGQFHVHRGGASTVIPTTDAMTDVMEIRRFLLRLDWNFDRLTAAVSLLKQFQV